MNGSFDANMGVIDEPQHLLTPQQLATKLNMSLKWVEKHTQGHRIPGQIKMGRVWRYDWVEIQKRLLSGQLLLEKTKSKRHCQ